MEKSVLLTNDDGIESDGLLALYQGLREVGDVTVVAPKEDQSGVGHSISRKVVVDEHELGYSVEGTPSDCIIVAENELGIDPDIVVSGCNVGPNIGEHILPQSGTVGGAAQAAYLGIPGIAVSLYSPENRYSDLSMQDYREAKNVTKRIVQKSLRNGVFSSESEIDYLNVNVPSSSVEDPDLRVTYPSRAYEIEVINEDRSGKRNEDSDDEGREEVRIRDSLWEKFKEGTAEDSEGTDRKALIDNKVSVSPIKISSAAEKNRIESAFEDEL